MKKIFRKIRLPIAIGLLTLYLFRFILFIGIVPTQSMEPTLSKGVIILASRIFDELSVGDIIVFQKGQELMIKRITAEYGDTIYINRETEEIFVNVAFAADVVCAVPEEHFFVTGDNAEESKDSRY